MHHQREFGFYPDPLRTKAGPITIRPLPDLERIVSDMLASDGVEDDWIYAPPHRIHDMLSGKTRELPYSSRVFGLPKTHCIEYAKPTSQDHLDFHLWALSFFVGMRLTPTEAGFLDATPLKRGTLVDFNLTDSSLTCAVEMAEVFWDTNRSDPHRAQLLVAAVHALFLGRNRLYLVFERFIYLYTAIDTCYRLTRELHQFQGYVKHRDRIKTMCDILGVITPTWADPALSGSQVATIRNFTLHEALFMDAPLGFAVHKEGINRQLTLEMCALICRLLVALIGGDGTDYIRSPVNTGQTYFLNPCTSK